MHTFTDLLNITLPVIQAPMAGVQGSRLTIATCQAGALGSLPAATLNNQQLINEIDTIRQHTSAPFNVNFFAHQPPQVAESELTHWKQILEPFYQRFNIQEPISDGLERKPFTQEQADIVISKRIPIVSFHFGLPEPKLLQQLKHHSITIMASATTVAEAEWLATNGADIIIAQGWEAGGHRSIFLNQDLSEQSGTLSLLPRVVEAVSLPIVAAGGIINAETAAAAKQLGASAVQVGTALLLSDEADTSPAYRQALQSPQAQHTVVTNIFSGGFARGIRNELIDTLGPICQHVPPFPTAQYAISPLKKTAEAHGNFGFSSFWASQNAPLCHPGSAADIIHNIAIGWSRT